MKKLTWKVCKHSTIIVFEITAALVAAVFVLWLALVWRLSQGPLTVDFLTESLEQIANSANPEMIVDIGTTQLTWEGYRTPIEIQAKDVQVMRADNTPIVAMSRVGVNFSKAHLMLGQLVPRAIRLYEPALRVIRWEDGHTTLNMGADPQKADWQQPADPSVDTKSQIDFIKTILGLLDNRVPKNNMLDGMRRVSVESATVLLEDKKIGLSVRSSDLDIAISRNTQGLFITTLSHVSVFSGQVAGTDAAKGTSLRGSFFYDWNSRNTQAFVYFNDLLLSRLSGQDETFSFLKEIKIPLKGTVNVTVSEDFAPLSGIVVVEGDAGTFNLPGLYDAPVAIQGVNAELRLREGLEDIVLEKLDIDMGGPRAQATADLKRKGEDYTLKLSAAVEGVAVDEIKDWWPESLTPTPRTWVTTRLSNGSATKATLAADVRFPLGDFSQPDIQELGGDIFFEGVTVDYFPPLEPVKNVKGSARYSPEDFVLDIESGTLKDMAVVSSDIDITELGASSTADHPHIDIDVSLSGALKTALEVLDSDPLNYPSDLGLDMTGMDGKASVDVNFKFPLHTKLTMAEVKVAAKAKLNDVLLNNIVSGYSLTGGPMSLSVDNNELFVEGSGRLAGMPLGFTWKKNFDKSAETQTYIKANIALEPMAIQKFGLPKDWGIDGILPSDIVYRVMRDKTASMHLRGDVTSLSFKIDDIGYEKKPAAEGRIDLSVRYDEQGNPVAVRDLTYETQGAVVKGDITLGRDNTGSFGLREINFPTLMMGESDMSLSFENKGTDGYTAILKGRVFDARFLTQEDDDNTSTYNSGADIEPEPPVELSMQVDRIITGDNKYLDDAKVYLKRTAWQRLDQFEVDGKAGGKSIYLRYMPTDDGRHKLRFEADDAGAALSVLGITDSIRGGRLVLDGQPVPNGGRRDLAGQVRLSDFTVVRASVLARLLNALSLSGLVDLLSGNGLRFERAESKFVWVDKWPPEQNKLQKTIVIKEGRTSGASLGLTLEGNINQITGVYDLNGTIVPVSDLNKLVEQIPLVGNLLTGGGTGVFAATYTIRGPKDQPTITVNPLAALAPGFLRTLFFEK